MGGFDFKKAGAEATKVSDEGCDVHVSDQNGNPAYYEVNGEEVPAVIRVAGIHSKRYRQAEETDRQGRFKPSELKKKTMYDKQFEKVVSCVLGFSGFYVDDVPIPFSRDNVRVIFKTCPWIYDEVWEAMQDISNFSSSNSATQ